MSRSRFSWIALAVWTFFITPPLAAWTPESQLVIAQEAAQHAPPDLYRQIDKHRRQFRSGVLAPFGDGDPNRHQKNPDGSGRLDQVILAEVEATVSSIWHHRSFSEIVYRLGVVAHYVADANNPLNTSADDPQEPYYFADYLTFMQQAEPRFPVIFYGLDSQLQHPDRLQFLLNRTLERGRALYPAVGQEYRRVGFDVGSRQFDDRSTAFAVAALSFSHAVSDIVRVLRYIWIEAGGADERSAPSIEEGRLLLLPRSVPSR